MTEGGGIKKINQVRRFYVASQVLADLLLSAGISILVAAVCFYLTQHLLIWFIPVFVVVLTSLVIVRKTWATSNNSIAAFLNQHYPELEESSALVLKPVGGLNMLELLQLEKINGYLQILPHWHRAFFRRINFAVLILIFACIMLWLASWYNRMYRTESTQAAIVNGHAARQEKVLPQIAGAQIIISPPTYTRKPARTQERFTLNVEEGAMIDWKIATNISVKQLSLLFNDKAVVYLKRLDPDGKKWEIRQQISKSGFYQVNIDGKLSELYQVQEITDQPPVIRIKSPKQYTYIDAGEAQKVTIDASVSDDYGVSNALIFATVAKGSGEAVKFKEYKLDFNTVFGRASAQYDLQKIVSLPALNMEPGDELYFYVQATDTHQQFTKTDVYTVSIQDTAQLLSMDGMLTGVNQKPEFFRSERQIILDTEHLLKDKDSVTTAKFNERSNDLGIDQKLLRLRYGKFLGEESESDINPADVKDDPVGNINNYGNAAVILDKYTDKHDNAEDAQFFDPELKKQLKATLTEMWKAELQLRLYKPQDALAFEYKALRLLKDLQQKSRMYVAKTSYNPPALKLEKRLTGDLSKIGQPVIKGDVKPITDQYENLKMAVGVLQQLRTLRQLTSSGEHTLSLANQQLSQKAAAQPASYLPALNAMRRILAKHSNINESDIAIVENAIQRTLINATKTPAAEKLPPDLGLSEAYYKNVNHLNR
jgi:hypothetical protein